jgi:hypothetical protein
MEAGIFLGVAAGVQAEPPARAYVGIRYNLVRQGLDKDFFFKTFTDPSNQFLLDVVLFQQKRHGLMCTTWKLS